MTRSHVKYVSKWHITRRFAQVRAVPGTVCKIADDSLPRFESWTCHQNRRSGLAREPGPAVCGSGVQHRRSRLRGLGPGLGVTRVGR
jgi:hypothetical protein